MVMPIKSQWNIDPESPITILRLISEMEGCCQILAALPPDGDDGEDYRYIREACNRYYKMYFKMNKEYEAAKRKGEGA